MAKYAVLRENGQRPLEAYHEAMKEGTESIFPITSEKGWQKSVHNLKH